MIQAMQPLSDFAAQLNKNSFGLTVTEQMSVPTPLIPGQTLTVKLAIFLKIFFTFRLALHVLQACNKFNEWNLLQIFRWVFFILNNIHYAKFKSILAIAVLTDSASIASKITFITFRSVACVYLKICR